MELAYLKRTYNLTAIQTNDSIYLNKKYIIISITIFFDFTVNFSRMMPLLRRLFRHPRVNSKNV